MPLGHAVKGLPFFRKKAHVGATRGRRRTGRAPRQAVGATRTGRRARIEDRPSVITTWSAPVGRTTRALARPHEWSSMRIEDERSGDRSLILDPEELRDLVSR